MKFVSKANALKKNSNEMAPNKDSQRDTSVLQKKIHKLILAIQVFVQPIVYTILQI